MITKTGGYILHKKDIVCEYVLNLHYKKPDDKIRYTVRVIRFLAFALTSSLIHLHAKAMQLGNANIIRLYIAFVQQPIMEGFSQTLLLTVRYVRLFVCGRILNTIRPYS